MKNVREKLNKCKHIKAQADGLSNWDVSKKLELADQAISLSFEVVEDLIDMIEALQSQLAGRAA